MTIYSSHELTSSVSAIDPLIQTEQLSLSYGQKTAFQNVNLAIAQGKITALVGPSGCGKSSLLFCLNRLIDLIPNCKVSGRVRMGTLDVLNPTVNTTSLRRRIGTILQKPNPFPLSIWQNIAFPLKEHGIKKRDRQEHIIETVLKDVGLWQEVKDRLKTNALSLSGGQQQRLCIARALALQPEVLLMDEPCSALDPLASGTVEDLIVDLRQRYTVLIVTHNLAQAKRIADYVAVFWVKENSGRLVEFGDCQQIFHSPNNPLTAAYIQGTRG